METREFAPASDHSELLATNPNRYELVLKVARRAKQLKDELSRMSTGETTKPIPMAITEMLAEVPEGANA